MNNQIKQLLFKLLLLIVLLFIADFMMGFFFKKISDIGFKNNPEQLQTEFVIKKAKADVIIIGNSRATNHYVPSIIADSLNRTVFNAGYGATYFTYFVTMIHAILKRHSPELIVFNVDPILLDKSYGPGSLQLLYPFYNDDIYYKNIVDANNPNNRYKLISKMYRYNSEFIPLVQRMFSKKSDEQYDGFIPQPNEGYNYPIIRNFEYVANDLDLHKVELLQNCIDSCKSKGVKLIFSVSPKFEQSNETQVSSYIHLKELLEKNNIPLIYMGDITVISDSTMYKDIKHLNHRGAIAFTKVFVGKLKEELNLISESSE